MGKFDLNSPTDFARLTLSGAGSILQLFTGRGESEWRIEEAAFWHDPRNKVVFHVFKSATDFNAAVSSVVDQGGRRNAKFLFPYQDGQLTEDLGRTPETFELDVLIFGDNYLRAFNNLMRRLNDPRPGTLQHPVRGELTCKMESYTITHASEARKAVAIRLTMVEHSFNGVFTFKRVDPSAPGALQKLTSAFSKIEAAINAVEGTINAVRTVKNLIIQNLNEYKFFFARVGRDMNATFNAGNDIPALLPTQDGGIQLDDGDFSDTGQAPVVSPNDPLANLPSQYIDGTLGTALATEQIQKNIEQARQNLSVVIAQMEAINNGLGALEFYSQIIGLKETALDLQDAYEKGKASSNVKLIEFITPREMSLREVAYANGIPVDAADQIWLLNPELLSTNYIAPGTKLRVAVS